MRLRVRLADHHAVDSPAPILPPLDPLRLLGLGLGALLLLYVGFKVSRFLLKVIFWLAALGVIAAVLWGLWDWAGRPEIALPWAF